MKIKLLIIGQHSSQTLDLIERFKNDKKISLKIWPKDFKKTKILSSDLNKFKYVISSVPINNIVLDWGGERLPEKTKNLNW